jgi:uncharacterized protein YecE (DUF72 family)
VIHRTAQPSQAPPIRVGAAGWTVPRAVAEHFAPAGTGLQRYASRFNAAEINTTFYRPHRPQTFERWAASVPAAFRFAVKVPKAITHEAGLVDTEDLVDRFLDQIGMLGPKLGPLLVQLPPKLACDPHQAARFFQHLRKRTAGPVALEPRHPSWFEADVDPLLREHDVARVAADPARVPEAAKPGASPRLAYYRLHGSPRMYWSAYDDIYLRELADRLRASAAAETWCVFDNTASGAAAANALTLLNQLKQPSADP